MSGAQVLSGERRWSVEQGDCLDLLRGLPDASVDAIVTDPPAGIGFLGRDWDRDKGGRDQWIAWLTERMKEAFRALKPGGHALVWALPRTSHWTGTALENAGFEVRDRIAHLFGSGFPKSLDLAKEIDKRAGHWRGKAGEPVSENASMSGANYERTDKGEPVTDDAQRWDGWGTALKPAAEDWWLVRKPVKGSIVRNVAEHGTGGINVDGCRVPHASAEDKAAHVEQVEAIKERGWGGRTTDVQFNTSPIEGCSDVSAAGRWPSHVLLTHAQDCERIGVRRVKAARAWYATDRQPSLFAGDETSTLHHGDGDGYETIEHWRCGASCPVAMLDEQSGVTASAKEPAQRWGREHDPEGHLVGLADGGMVQAYGDEGGASRYFTTFPPFFYTPKCDRTDREKGCEYLPTKTSAELTGRKPGSAGLEHARSGSHGKRKNTHPTVKSTDLMRWLVRLITPPGGIVLDPFTGSGSTGVACSAEVCRFIGFELSAEYAEIARARIVGDAPLLNVGGL